MVEPMKSLLKGGREELQSDVVRIAEGECGAVARIDDATIADTEL